MARQTSTHSTNLKTRVLISGASFAGLTTAYWMSRLGYEVTVVEIAKTLKMGGTPVNIEGDTVDIMRRMGMLERIQAASLPKRPVEFVNENGDRLALMSTQPGSTDPSAPEYEIERDELLQMQFNEIKDDVDFLFDESIANLQESPDEVVVTFRSGIQKSFALVFGCDGNHSAVRKICFGEESAYSLFLQLYFSITIVNKLLLEENTAQIYNVPGKTVMLNGYNGKTDICFCYFSEKETPYDYRDQAQQRRMIEDHFRNQGWRTSELLDEVNASKNFYFDKLCQIKMPSWTKGRVALVGDAAYCPSPAAGLGGSLAIIGATALADAFHKHPGDFETAFHEYNNSLRPTIEKIQADAIEFGLETFAPRSEEAIRARNDRFNNHAPQD
jgi:2-polyprenyl-6-methoxyphenol hydroxylase-like FAD-dependent oxidoreductase